MARDESRYLYGAHARANGIRQHYLRYGGKGTPLIVVPGITSPAATWGFVGERLGERYDTYVLDVRGRGLSQGGPDLAYTLDDYADDVAALAAELGLVGYVVLGHSMGGRITARVGSRHPGAASRLVLIDPPVSGPGRRPYAMTLQSYLDRIHEARAGRLDLEALRKTYPLWKEEHLRLRAQWLHTCDDSAIRESVRGFQEEEVQSDLTKIRVPT
jgi:N-formylmaleamate deformylase